MIDLDDELAEDYLSECREHLPTIETNLLAIEEGGAEIDEERVNCVFRAVHSIKGGTGFFDLAKVRDLAHRMEDALALIRSRKLVPTRDRVGVLLCATDRLRELIQSPGASNQADLVEIMAALAGLCSEPAASAGESRAGPGREANDGGGRLLMLLVEDDFASRLLMQTFLSRYGDCHIAVNGKEAVEAFRALSSEGGVTTWFAWTS